MSNTIKLTNKGYFTNIKNTYDIGLQGQDYVELACLEKGYLVYKKNLKKIGLEIDLILYKYIPDKDLLIIRIIEVKTRNSVSLHGRSDLEYLGIDKKWLKIKRHIFDISSKLKEYLNLGTSRHIIHFDLALVAHNSRLSNREGAYRIYNYIEDVDLLI